MTPSLRFLTRASRVRKHSGEWSTMWDTVSPSIENWFHSVHSLTHYVRWELWRREERFEREWDNRVLSSDNAMIWEPFVPWNKGDTKDYGKMTVNNKVSIHLLPIDLWSFSEDNNGLYNECNVGSSSWGYSITSYQSIDRFYSGCSNSIITRFVQVFKWPETVILISWIFDFLSPTL